MGVFLFVPAPPELAPISEARARMPALRNPQCFQPIHDIPISDPTAGSVSIVAAETAETL
jgi:hypothetical protein